MSTDAPKPFFAKEENSDVIRRLSQALQSMEGGTNPSTILAPTLKQIVDLILAHKQQFDEYCTANIEWIGVNLIRDIDEFLGASPDKHAALIKSIFAAAYRFLCELEFTQPADPSFEIMRIKSFVEEHLGEFASTDKQQIIYANYTMPAHLAKRLINHPSIADFRKFADTVESAATLKREWDRDLTEREARLAALKDNLKNITSAFNFVGLVNGFQRMSEAKVKEKHFAFRSLLFLGALMLLPIVLQIGFVVQNIDIVEGRKGILIYTLPTVIALEVILFYFFRVVLTQFRSVKGQLLQLDLRVSLCQFIQSYAEYSTKIKVQDANALSKFEALIFSGLVTEEAGIPSTFDGIEQIANLIKSIRGTT